MTPSPNQNQNPMQQGRYRSSMTGGMPPQRGVAQAGGPAAGGPPGIPPMSSQARMPAPGGDMPTGPAGGEMQPQDAGGAQSAAMQPGATASAGPMQGGGSAMAAMQAQQAAQPGRMAPPYNPPQANANRPGYSGIGAGAGQRAQTSGPMQPGSPITERQQAQNAQNQGKPNL